MLKQAFPQVFTLFRFSNRIPHTTHVFLNRYICVSIGDKHVAIVDFFSGDPTAPGYENWV